MTRFHTRRSRAIVAGLVLALVAAGGIAALASGDSKATSNRPLIITAEAQRRTLTDDVTLKGSVGRAEQRQVDASEAGRVSAVHVDDGATVDAGQAILAIDGRDSVAVPGDLPFFRDLDVGARGNDVHQLERILAAAGFSPGAVDDTYTEQTRIALASWQAKHGYPAAAPEKDKTVTVTLGQGTGYTLGHETSGGVVIGAAAASSAPAPQLSKRRPQDFITDGLTHVALQSMNALVNEGSTAQFRLTADRDHEAVDIDLTTGGSAEGDDFIAPVLPVKLGGNVRSMVIDVPIRQDDLVEPDETISLTLVQNPNVHVDQTPAVSTIVSDDVPEVVMVGGAAVAEGGRALLKIAADQAPVHDTQIALTAGGDATPGKDYDRLDAFVVLPAGMTQVDVPVQTLGDDTIEDAEQVVVTIASTTSGAYKVGRAASAVVTIDRATGAAALPTITVHTGATHVTEGQPVPVSLSFSRAVSDDVTVALAYAGDAAPGADYNPAPGTIRVPAGTTSMDVAVPTVDDDVVEHDHTLTISLAPSSAFHAGTPSAVTVVVESEDLPELSLAGGVDRIGEGSSRGFTIVADQPAVDDISIAYQVVGSATPGQDFDALPGVVILPAGATQVTVPVITSVDDVSFKPTDMIVGQWPIRIGQVLVDEGQSVAPGAPLMSLTDAGLTVTLRASATDRTKLKIGQKATVKLQDSSDSVEGTLSALDETASVDAQTKEQYYEGKIDVGKLPAADGASVTIDVVLDQRPDALTVPIAAVKQNGSGKDVVRVMDLDHGGKVTEVPVTTGISEGSYIEVRAGLKGGEVLVVQVDEPK